MLSWVLLMIFLVPVEGFQTAYLLNTFATQEECQIERDRIGFAMAEACPYEADFRIECREKQVPQKHAKLIHQDRVDYTELIRDWAKGQRPGQPFAFKVTLIKPVMVFDGHSGILALQVKLYYLQENEQYILFVKHGIIYGWIYTGKVGDDEEAEEEPEEVFSYKDIT